jgi:hypothetical protein
MFKHAQLETVKAWMSDPQTDRCLFMKGFKEPYGR